MKILNAEQTHAADAYTIVHEPVSSIDLMERAATACFNWIIGHFSKQTRFIIVCGMGNNGGDGLAIGRLLYNKGYNAEIYIVPYFSKASDEFLANKERLDEISGIKVKELTSDEDIVVDNKPALIIDAILGSGLSRPVEGKLATVIQKINSIHCPVVAIDVPSGLMMEDNSKADRKNIINANATLTFESPKLSFLFAENVQHVGDFYILHIGIDKEFIASQKSSNYFVTREMITPMLRPRQKYSHKGNYGHALLAAGSHGKMGACVLAAKACLRSGVGLLTVHIPQCGYEILQTAVPEAMVMVDEEEKEISGIKDLAKFNVIGAGPGIGTSKATAQVIKLLIQSKVPMVLDADALNILAENKTWLSFLPKGCIFTPHPGEFARLAGKTTSGYDAYILQCEFAIKYGVYLVLKGAHSAIATPDGEVYFNSTGNPGMATGGSGDTLTGIITGLMAQGYTPKQAAILGVYLHGLAGDIAADEFGENSLIAEDITDCLGKAFKEIGRQ
ncbi:MAG: NAD(P)H-hydrate dehydratase [Bacteroidia bacterium]